MECRARRPRAVFKISTGSHTPCGRCRGGSKGLRPFRRGRWDEETAGVRSSRQKPIWSYVYAHVSERRRRYGATFLHVTAPAVIWTYVSACRSAGDDMELRFCISQRRRRYGATFLHAAAPAALWSYVSAYRSGSAAVDATSKVI